MSDRRPERILVMDRGAVELAIPDGWSAKPDEGGFIKMEDPLEECLLEASYLVLPQGIELPALEARFEVVLVGAGPAARDAPVAAVDRDDLRYIWIDYPYMSEDPHRGGERRDARGRWLLGDNGLYQVLMTFYYWVDDAAWAVPAWEWVVETLQLGRGTLYRNPGEHWALQRPS